MVTVTNGVLLAKTLKNVEISNEKVILSAERLVISSGKVVRLTGTVKEKETGNYAGTISATVGNIGNWTISNSGLVSNGTSGTLEVYHNGGRFLTINSTSSTTLMSIRADGGTGISMYTQDTTGKCLTMTAQTGGTAIESYGSVKMTARSGYPIFELIDLIGNVRVGGMSIKARSGSGTTYLTNDDCFFLATNTSTILLPGAPTEGKVIFICRGAHADVTVSSQNSIYYIYNSGSLVTSVSMTNDGEIDIFIFCNGRWSFSWMNN